MVPPGRFLISLLAGVGQEGVDALVSAGHAKLGVLPGKVPEAQAAFPQWKKWLFVYLQMALLPDT